MDPSQFIIFWNQRFPLDHWYRRKYNIRFGSKEHRETNLFDMYLEFKEDKFYNQVRSRIENESTLEKRYKENGLLQPREIEIDDSIFDDFDYDAFDEE